MDAVGLTPRRRAVGIGDEPPNNGDALGENWRSALCVTSLYDSYVAVQHENDALKDQLRQLQHANELLQVAATKPTKSPKKMRWKVGSEDNVGIPNDTAATKTNSPTETNDDHANDDHANDTNDDHDDREQLLIQEIRLLRAEKAQQELLFDRRRAQLEALAAQHQARFAELQTKYDDKCALDPLAPQRAALASRALSQALEQGAREKEALAQRYHQAERDRDALRTQLEQLTEARAASAARSVRAALDKWALARVARAWQQWRLAALSDRVRAQQQRETQQLRDAHERERREAVLRRAAAFCAAMLQSSTQRRFAAWRRVVRERKQQRARIETTRRSRTRRVWQAWQQRRCIDRRLHEGAARLAKLETRHAVRRAWQRWHTQAAQTNAARQQRVVDALQTHVATLEATVQELMRSVETVKAERDQLTVEMQRLAAARDEHVDALHRDRTFLCERVAELLAQRTERYNLRECVRVWRRIAVERRALRDKAALMTRTRTAKALHQSVAHWHGVAHAQRRFQLIAGRAMQRMRLLGAYRCFAAWRAFATTRRERVATLTRVVGFMANQHVARSFKTWQLFRAGRARHRQRLGVLCTLVARVQLSAGFVAWKRAAAALGRQAEQHRRQEMERAWRARLEQSKRELQALRGAFLAWQRSTRSGKRFRQLTRACALKWSRGTQGRCLDAWRAFVARRGGVRDALRRLVVKKSSGELLAAFARWRTHALVRAKDDERLALEQARDARVAELEAELLELRCVEAAARVSGAERAQQLHEELETTRAALEAARGTSATYKMALRHVSLSLRQQRTRLACLRAWQVVWQHARRREQLVARANEDQQTQTLRRVLVRWHALVQRRQRVLTAAAHVQRVWHSHVAHGCLGAWHTFAAHARRVRHTTETFERRSRARLCQRALAVWRTDARKTRLLRKTLEQIWLSSVHAHLAECFTTWRERAAQLTLELALRRRQCAVDAIRARVCARWAARSLEHVFAAWREGVTSQQRVRAGLARLQRLHDLRLYGITLEAWQHHHEQLKAQRAWLLAWQSKQLRQAVVTSWHDWKQLTVERRLAAMAQLQAACHDHELALAASKAKVAALEEQRERLREQVETLERARGDAGEMAARLAASVMVTKCWHAWLVWCRARQACHTRLSRMAQTSDKQLRQRVLRAWANEVDARRERQRAASAMAAGKSHRQLRAVVSAWQAMAHRQRSMKRVIRRFYGRHTRETKCLVLRAWRVFADRHAAARRLFAALDKLTLTLSRRSAFVTWQLAARAQSALLAAQTEQQRRMAAFLMDKHAYAQAKYFAAWRTLVVARHTRRTAADKMAQRMRQRRLRALWTAWRAAIDWEVTNVRVLATLARLAHRQRLRTALHRWRAQDTRARVAILESGRHELAQQLAATREHAERLEQSLGALQHAHAELREATAASATQERDAQRQLALQMLLARAQCVPRATLMASAAFERWRRLAGRRSQQLAALRRCERWVLSRQRARCFQRWRRRAAVLDRIATRRLRNDAQLCRGAFTAWTRLVRECAARRRRFLVRWIDATHTAQVRTALENQTATAFRVWQLQARAARMSQQCAQLTSASEAQQTTKQQQQRARALLAKWSWRAYHDRCQALRGAMAAWRTAVAHDSHALLQLRVEHLEAERVATTTRTRDATADVPRLAQSLQALFRRLSAAQSCAELFDAVASSLAQLSLGSAAGVLYLLDPTANELWTQRRDAPQTAPAALGLAGCALSGLSTLLVENAAADARFHPLVDQLAIAGVVPAAGGGATAVDLFSTAIVGADGAVYGVLQIAFRREDAATQQHQPSRLATETHLRLLGHACAFFVEQIIYEMVRHARDRQRARAPASFSKLFKQTKHWRKYFVQVEKDAQKTQRRLEQLLAEQDVLLDEKQRLMDALARFEREQHAVAEQRDIAARQSETHARLVTHLLTYKKKTARIKELAEEKDRRLSDKTRELARLAEEHAAYRQQVEAREWQQALRSAAAPAVTKPRTATTAKAKPTSPQSDESDGDEQPAERRRSLGARLLEGADVAALQNQLVRAESDSMLLVKAVDVATRHHGDLPEALKVEVNRIALRLKKPRE